MKLFIKNQLRKFPRLNYFIRKKLYLKKIHTIVSNISKEIEIKKTDKPIAALVELNNICNLNCPMCESNEASREKGYINIDLFKKISEELKELGINSIGLHTVGEPLLHPEIVEII